MGKANGFYIVHIIHLLKKFIKSYFDFIDKTPDVHKDYDKNLLVGDFNLKDKDPYIECFLYKHDLINMTYSNDKKTLLKIKLKIKQS